MHGYLQRAQLMQACCQLLQMVPVWLGVQLNCVNVEQAFAVATEWASSPALDAPCCDCVAVNCSGQVMACQPHSRKLKAVETLYNVA